MTHIVHPYAHRLGIIKDWKSRWFGARGQYQVMLKSDLLLREFLAKRLRGSYVGSIDIERNEKMFRLIIRTSRPGMLIGRNGEGSAKLREDIFAMARRKGLEFPKEFRMDIEEIKSPESQASIVAQMIAEGLEKRLPFRMVLKQTMEKVMANRDVKGAKLSLSGRLGGAEMARFEQLKRGGIPLQTFRSDIDFVREKAYLPYGVVGIKVWIYRGDVFEKQDKGVRSAA